MLQSAKGARLGCGKASRAESSERRPAARYRQGRKPLHVTAVAEVPEAISFKTDPDVKPYYRKFQSEGEHLRASIREWKEISAEGIALPSPTARSKILYLLNWVKFTLIPEPLRYIWFITWSAIRQAWYPYHKKAVLEGARFDTWLRQKSFPGQEISVSRKVALKRFHWRMNAWDDIVYRYPIVKAWVFSAASRRKQQNAKGAEDAAIAPPPAII